MAANLQQLCIDLLGVAVKTHLEPRCKNLPLWDNGLGKFAAGLVKSAGVPDVTGDEIAAGALKALGIGEGARPGGLYRPIRRGTIAAAGNGRVIETTAEVVR
jgi:hypothetical protein